MAASRKTTDGPKALDLARKAVQLAPDRRTYLNTLGVVQYRLGRYQEARDSLEKSLREGDGQSIGFDLFFLAMCHQRLGDTAQSRLHYDRAAAWVTEQKVRKQLSAAWAKELAAIQSEAESILSRPAISR